MNLEQFNDHLDRRGADLAAWPEADADAARELIRRSPEAGAAWRAAAAVDVHLTAMRDHRAPAGLAGRITAAAHVTPRPGWLASLLTPRWRPALLALLPLVAGFYIGLRLPDSGDGQLPGDLLALAFDADLYQSDLYLELEDEQP